MGQGPSVPEREYPPRPFDYVSAAGASDDDKDDAVTAGEDDTTSTVCMLCEGKVFLKKESVRIVIHKLCTKPKPSSLSPPEDYWRKCYCHKDCVLIKPSDATRIQREQRDLLLETSNFENYSDYFDDNYERYKKFCSNRLVRIGFLKHVIRQYDIDGDDQNSICSSYISDDDDVNDGGRDSNDDDDDNGMEGAVKGQPKKKRHKQEEHDDYDGKEGTEQEEPEKKRQKPSLIKGKGEKEEEEEEEQVDDDSHGVEEKDEDDVSIDTASSSLTSCSSHSDYSERLRNDAWEHNPPDSDASYDSHDFHNCRDEIGYRFDQYQFLFTEEERQSDYYTKRVIDKLRLLPPIIVTFYRKEFELESPKGKQERIAKEKEWVKYMKLSKEERKRQKRRYRDLVNHPRKCMTCRQIKHKEDFMKNYWRTMSENGWQRHNLRYDEEYGYSCHFLIQAILHPTEDGASKYGEFPTEALVVDNCRHCYLMRIETIIREKYHWYHTKEGITFNELPKPIVNYLSATNINGEVDLDEGLQSDSDGEDDVLYGNVQREEDLFRNLSSPSSLREELAGGEYEIVYEYGDGAVGEFFQRCIHHGKSTVTFRIGPLPSIVNNTEDAQKSNVDGDRSDDDNNTNYEAGGDDDDEDEASAAGINVAGGAHALHGIVERKCTNKHDWDWEKYDYPGQITHFNGLNFSFFETGRFQQQNGDIDDKCVGIQLYGLPVNRYHIPEDEDGNRLPVQGQIRVLDRRIPCRWIPKEAYEDETGYINYGEMIDVPESTLDAEYAENKNRQMAALKDGIHLPTHPPFQNTHWIDNHLSFPPNLSNKIRTFYGISWCPPQPYAFLEKNDVLVRIVWIRQPGRRMRWESIIVCRRKQVSDT